MTIDKRCKECGFDGEGQRAEITNLKRLLTKVDQAFDPKSSIPWDTRLALRAQALDDVHAAITPAQPVAVPR